MIFYVHRYFCLKNSSFSEIFEKLRDELLLCVMHKGHQFDAHRSLRNEYSAVIGWGLQICERALQWIVNLSIGRREVACRF